MAENKKSFVLYCDLIKSIEHLTNEEKGILFNHLLEYVNDRNPILEDRLILTAWKPIELQLKRDLIKFEEVKSKRSDAGKESARLRALKNTQQNSTNSTSVESVQHSSTNSTVNDTDTDNVNENVNDTSFIKKEFDFSTLKNTTWSEKFCITKKISVEKFNTIFDKFIDNIKLKGQHLDYKDPEKEVKNHFVNWYDKQPTQPTTIATYKRNQVIK